MVVFAVFVSIVFATLMRDSPGDQFRFALRLIAGFIAAGIVIGWLLYPLPL
jgi:NhaP-type Na+/H+ or K+/H+ antiporter